ncbi:MAG: hypothetical protein COT92_03610 [Candidatus Doudnabacteria bacterium CG10_big_fil_rev_8_21_14_0_10_42_18]|uniref:Histidyl-tRNA synthetase n=1 Tax=Candidatus Doudnabacteria bacterium CG10_big_fil_rev_8_21_14_0_10_42_18 TaxID=1974552 RepID=A0A2H0VA33_9BACT|nr:MAG: hypothetical protein COT92_03610 [Candidatus Doudnabacteria bacterium CG10_big_fil_rev_8_21_14_0_10_42_18]
MGRPRKNNSLDISVSSGKKAKGLEGLGGIIAETDPLWDLILTRLARISRVYGFKPVETPLLEEHQLYQNVYRTAPQKLERLLTLDTPVKPAVVRESLLPSVLRVYSENKVYEQKPMSKWQFQGFTARAEMGTKALVGDYNFGFEIFGTFNHLSEAQTIGAVWQLVLSLGLSEAVIEINNIGNAECQRVYGESLADFLSARKYDLCDSCNEHLVGRPINVFRCRNLGCQAVVSEAPTILDFLDEISHKQFTNILEALDELGIPYQLNPSYVGPEYHSKTNFVIKHKLKGQTVVLGEGGYHDDLMDAVCHKNFCCFGFSGSLSVLYEILKSQGLEVEDARRNDVFLVPLGELAAKRALRLFKDLTNEKISVYDHFGEGGVKNQLKQAQDTKTPVALIMGQKEAMDEMVILRDVKSGMQEIISYDKIIEEVKKRLGR